MAPAHEWKRIAAQVAIGVCALAAVAGVSIFALSLRPTRLQLDPGQQVRWTLTSVSTPLLPDGSEGPTPRQEDAELLLIGTGANEGLLLGPAGRSDAASLLRIESTGACSLLDGAGRPGDGGRCFGLLDFNLLPLPPGNEQAWDVSVNWSFPPPAKRTMQVRARRMKAGSKPEFLLKPVGANAVEWLDQGTYRQVRKLQASYRFNGSAKLWDRAQVSAEWAIERPAPQPALRWRIVSRLELAETRDLDEDPAALRQLALAVIEAQDLLRDGGGPRVAAVAARLNASTCGVPRLRALAARLAEALARLPSQPPRAAVARSSWVLACGELQPGERHRAEQLVTQLTAAGFPAFLEAAPGGRLRVVSGPLTNRDEARLQALVARFPYLKPVWREVR